MTQQQTPQTQPRRQIFRQHAIQQYIQSGAKDTLPKTISPFTFTLWWILLLLTLLIGLFIWSIPIPYYAYAPGIVLGQQLLSHPTHGAQVLVFFPASARSRLHRGQPVLVRMEVDGLQIAGHLEHITSQPLTPEEIGNRYALSADQLQALPPAIIIGTVRLHQRRLLQRYIGSSVRVQYQEGTRHILSLLLNIDT